MPTKRLSSDICMSPEKAVVLTYWGSFALIAILAAIAMPLIVISGGYDLAE